MRSMLKYMCAALMLAFAAQSQAGAAPEVPSDPAAARVANFYATLTDTMKEGKSLGMMGREQKLAPAVDATFDLPLMAQFMVGPDWAAMSAADRDAVVAAFRRYTIADYAHNFASFDGQRFTVDPAVMAHGPDRIVQTKLVPGHGDTVPLNYRMRQAGDSWKIVDVFLDGFVSELSTKRSDFAATVSAGGGAALAQKLDTLASEMSR